MKFIRTTRLDKGCLVLYYLLSRTFVYIELLLWPLEYFHQIHLRVCLHVNEMKSHPGMKKILFTREFDPGMKRVEFHSGMEFNLKENFIRKSKNIKSLHLIMLKIFVIYIVINIIGNFLIKATFSSLRRFLATKSPLKMTKNVFYFILKATLVL